MITWTWVATCLTAQAGISLIAVGAYVVLRWTTCHWDRKDIAARTTDLETAVAALEHRYNRLVRGRKEKPVYESGAIEDSEKVEKDEPVQSREQARAALFQRLRNQNGGSR